MNAPNPSTFETPAAHETRPAAPSYGAFAAPAVAPMRDARTKSPMLAALLSAMPGLGQVYVGYYPRGFVNIAVVAGIISILASARVPEPAYVPLLGVFLAFFWLYNVIDAARIASLYNNALAGGHEPDLPEGFNLPGIGGSIFGGVVLMAAGLVLLLHTRWGVRLDWIEEWWPVFPILFGAYLVGKAVLDRAGRQPRA